MIKKLIAGSLLWLQGLTYRGTELQMMPMYMTDMWVWLLLIAAIVIVGVTLAVYFSTRPRQIVSPTTHVQTPPPTPIIENPNTAAITEEVGKPVTKSVQLKRALEIVRPTLNDDERRVVNEIVKAGGEILQSDLPERTDFSKATVSKLIKSLETMGVVSREKHKWTYWVRISEKLISRTKNA